MCAVAGAIVGEFGILRRKANFYGLGGNPCAQQAIQHMPDHRLAIKRGQPFVRSKPPGASCCQYQHDSPAIPGVGGITHASAAKGGLGKAARAQGDEFSGDGNGNLDWCFAADVETDRRTKPSQLIFAYPEFTQALQPGLGRLA